jgi:predicted DCC family thiol-disulfide oxidoreductase YuxK
MIRENPIVLFDGVCNLCNGLVKFIIKGDRRAKIRFTPLQSAAGKLFLLKYGLPSTDINSVVFIKGDKYFLRSSAILHLLRELGGAWKLFYGLLIIPPIIRDFFYDIIARTRYRIFGRTDSCMVPSEEEKNRFLTE